MANYDDTARAFAQGMPAAQGNLHVTPNDAYSYALRIAYKHEDSGYMVNMKPTTRTTNAHRSAIIRALKKEGYTHTSTEEVNGYDHHRYTTERY